MVTFEDFTKQYQVSKTLRFGTVLSPLIDSVMRTIRKQREFSINCINIYWILLWRRL